MACKKAIKQRLYEIAEARSEEAVGNSLEIAQKKASRINKEFYEGNPVVSFVMVGDVVESRINIPDSLVESNYEALTRWEQSQASEHVDKQKREGNWDVNEEGDITTFEQRQSAFQIPSPALDFSAGIVEDNSEQVRNEMYEKSKKAISNFIETFGINIEAVNRLPGDPIARVNVLTKLVEVVEGRADATTLPEEAAHILVAMLRGSSIYKKMMSDVQAFDVYAEVLQDYPDYTPEQQLEEAAGKLIGRLIGYTVDSSVSIPKEIEVSRSWWQRILDYLRNLFSRQPDKLQSFEKLANGILIGEFSSDVMEISEDSFLYFESRGSSMSEVQRRTINKLNKTTNEVKIPSGSTRYMHTPTGKEIRFRVSDIVKRVGKSLFGISEFKEDRDKNVYLNKGTVIHLYNQLLINRLSDGSLAPSDGTSALTSVQKEEMIAEVMSSLKSHPQFSEPLFQEKAFYDLGEYLNTLYRGVSSIYNNVIAKDANAQFLTEQIIYSPTRDLAGTIDLMVVYSNGQIGMYDYKTTQLKKDRFGTYVPIDDRKRQLYEVQLSEYKDVLVREYGVNRETGFAESRVIPIHLDYTRDPKTGRLNGGINKGSGEGLLMDAPGVASKLRESVKQLTVAGELTGDRDADVLIQKLYNQRGALRKKISDTKLNKDEKKRLEQRLNNIQKTIDSVIINETIVPVLKSLEAIVDDITENASALSYSKLLEYKELLDIYGDFNTDFRKYIKTDEDRANVAFFNNKMEEAAKLVVQTIVDRHVAESGDNDLLNGGKPKSFLGGLFDGIIHWANPVLKRLGDLTANARERARMASKKASEVISAGTKEYLDWAKKNGMSGVRAFDIFFNENTGNLVTEFNKKFYEDKEMYSDIILKKDYTRMDKAIAWFETWYHFDYAKHEESVAKYENILKENPDLSEAEILRQVSWMKDSTPANNPIYWVKNSGYVRPNTFSLDFLKNSGYVNDKWLYIQENLPAKKFYDMYIQYNREFAQLVGYDIISPNFVANIRADMIDNIARMGVKALGMTKTEIIRSMEVYEYDEVYGSATNADGTPIQTVPLLYIHDLKSPLSAKEKNKIEEELKKKYDPDSIEYREAVDYEIWKAEKEKGIQSKNRDLGSSLILMADAVYKYAYMNDVKDAALSLREILKIQKEQSVDKYGRSLLDRISRRLSSRFGVNQDTFTAFDKFLNYHVFSQTLQSTDATMEFGSDENPEGKVTISGSKALRSLMTMQSVISIALSPVISTANFLQAKASTIINGKKGTYYNSANLKEAVQKYGKRDLKAVGLIYLLEPAAKNRRHHDALKASASAITRAFNMETMFVLQRGFNTSKIADQWGIEMPAFGDEHIDNVILLAMAENYVLDSDGQLRSKSSATNPPKDPNAKSIIDLIEVDAETKSVSLEAIGLDNITRFRRMVQEAASEIKGSSTADQQNQINFSILGQVLTHFRNWLPHLARERFGGLRYNETMGEVQVGRYAVAMGEILSFAEKDIISNVKSTIKDLTLMGVEIGTFGISSKLGFGKKINRSVAKLKLLEFNEKYPNNPLADPDLDQDEALDRFVELRKRQLKAFLTEAQIVFGFLLLVSALKSLDWDDEEEVGLLANMSYKMLKRSYLELSFFLSPNSVDQIIKSPVALWSLARQMGRMVSNANQETLELVGILEENRRDKTPLFYHTSKMIPGVNQVLSLLSYFPQTEESSILDKVLFERVFK